MLYVESLNYKNNPNGRVGGLIERGEELNMIDGAKIPVMDIISFGSPCQDLSVAGKQTGLDGSCSGLFMEAVRITRDMRGVSRRCRKSETWQKKKSLTNRL